MRVRSNLLIDHVLDTPRPSPEDIWRVRKGTREIRILEVGEHSVWAANVTTGRRTRIQISVLVATYLKQPPATV